MMNRHAVVSLLSVAAAASAASAQTPSLAVIEPAPTYLGTATSGGLARSGGAVAGASIEGGRALAMRWTRTSGRQDIGGWFAGLAISSDGNTVLVDNGQLWNPITGIQTTGPAPVGRSFDPQAGRPSVGDNGSWIISTFRGSGSSVAPFRWTPATGWQSLPGLYRLNTNIFDATPDGQAWVGETGDFAGGSQFVYRNNAWETLSFQPRALSDNANFVTGYINVGPGINYRSILLTPTGQGELPVLPGFERGAIATDVSNDGRTVVGRVFTADGQRADAFIWREGSGMQLLRDYLSTFGLVFPSSINVDFVSCDSDGLTYSWTNTSGEFGGVRGFVATIPAPGMLSIFVGVGCMIARRSRS